MIREWVHLAALIAILPSLVVAGCTERDAKPDGTPQSEAVDAPRWIGLSSAGAARTALSRARSARCRSGKLDAALSEVGSDRTTRTRGAREATAGPR